MLDHLPEPPDELTGHAYTVWYEVGRELLDSGTLTRLALDRLEDLCYWEQQKVEAMERLTSGGEKRPTTGSELSSLVLSNLKAVQKEIDQIRRTIGLDPVGEREMADTPLIPDEAYDHLPDPLADICEAIPKMRERDLFLTYALPVAASHLPNVLTEHSDGFVTSDFYTLGVAGAGTVRRMTQMASELGRVLDEETRMNRGREAGLYIAAGERKEIDSQLFDRNGSGVLLDLKSAGMDSRTWPVVASLAEQAIEYNRLILKIGEEPLQIRKPGLSMAIGGTPAQLMSIAEQAGVEQGELFHFALYICDAQREWKSRRPDREKRSLFQRLGEVSRELALLENVLSERKVPLYVEMSDDQWSMIDDTFAEKMELIDELRLPEVLQICNDRMATLTIRMVSIFTLIRHAGEGVESLSRRSVLAADPSDLISALWLADTYLKHAIRLFQHLPDRSEASDDSKGERYRRFFATLPPSFRTSEAVELAEKLQIPHRTAKRYLADLVNDGLLNRVRRGQYSKRSTANPPRNQSG